MNSTSSNPSDAEAVRRLLAESGVAETQELSDALAALQAEARMPAPAPNAELEALFTPAVAPLPRPSRRRGYLLGGAIIAAMAAGTTGVAATGGMWITAQDTPDAPAPVNFEQIPAPTPVPAPVPAQTDPEELPPLTVPDAPVPEPAPAAQTPEPAAPAPAGTEHQAGEPAQPAPHNGAGAGGSERRGSGPDTGRGGESRGWEKGQNPSDRQAGKNDGGAGRDTGQGRGEAGKGGPQHGQGTGRGHGSD